MGKWSRSFQSESHSLLFAIKQTSIHKISWDNWTVFGNNFLYKRKRSHWYGDVWCGQPRLKIHEHSGPCYDSLLPLLLSPFKGLLSGISLSNVRFTDTALVGLVCCSEIQNHTFEIHWNWNPSTLNPFLGDVTITFKSIKVSKTSHQWSDSQIQTPGGWRMIPAPKYQKVKIPLKIIFDLNLLHELVLAL